MDVQFCDHQWANRGDVNDPWTGPIQGAARTCSPDSGGACRQSSRPCPDRCTSTDDTGILREQPVDHGTEKLTTWLYANFRNHPQIITVFMDATNHHPSWKLAIKARVAYHGAQHD